MPKLAEWLKENRVSPGKFAKRIGVEKSTVYRWIDATDPTFPQREHLDLVYAETNGEVTAHDFIADAPHPDVGVPDSADARQENKSAVPKIEQIASRDDAHLPEVTG